MAVTVIAGDFTLTTRLSPEQIRTNAANMVEFLKSLPVAENSPLIYERLVGEIAILDSIVNKLKAFVRFLSKLNPAEYLRWMHNAFAQMVTPVSVNQTEAKVPAMNEEPDDLNFTFEIPTTKASKQKKAKKKRAKIFA
jgi:hypothetical protein